MILVIEDEPDIRELIRLNLELDGFHVMTAEDGEQGLRSARARPPDAIVLDVMMPGLDGWEVLGRLKAGGGALAQVPVLVLTARSGDLDRVKGGIEGAVRYLTKPFNPAGLRAAVADVLHGGPEPLQRRHAQHQALSDLALLEAGAARGTDRSQANPRLSRLGGPPASRARTPSSPVVVITADQLDDLSARQRQLIAAVAEAPTVSDAANRLAVSRTSIYASLRRITRKLNLPSVSALVSLARAGGLT